MPKRYLTGGGVRPKKQEKSTRYLCKILNFVKFYIKKIPDATSRCRGAILIEFAICMPVLIILLFYIHDLVKIKRLYSQTEFIGHQMANILQNISQKRENKAITCPDIKHASALAWLTIPRDSAMTNLRAYTNVYYVSTGSTEGSSGGSAEYSLESIAQSCQCDTDELMYIIKTSEDGGYEYIGYAEEGGPTEVCNSENTEFELGYDCSKFYLAGATCGWKGRNCDIPSQASAGSQQTDPGKAACAWGVGFYRNPDGTWSQDGEIIFSDKASSTVRWGENVETSAIYPTLKVDDNKGKIIIEVQFHVTGEAKTAFGLRLVNPRPSTSSNDTFFSSVVIFQPKSGLFSTTAPKD